MRGGFKARAAKEPLTYPFCQSVVISSTPKPHLFKPGSDASSVTLFQLGVVGSDEKAIFNEQVRRKIDPWTIADSDLQSSPGSTVQQAAFSITENAV